jgi:predicted urease superfamily metal-dependent hydrolase
MVSPFPQPPAAPTSISAAAADATEGLTDPPPSAIALVDSHCHIVFRNFDADLDEVAARWREAGVGALVHACVEPAEIPAIRALADRFPELRYAVGVHPLDTQHWQEHTARDLRIAARADSRVVAIGELGLDLYRETNLERQLAVLEPQLDLAVELDLPVIIHCRDAAAPMLELLAARAQRGAVPRGVMHCWGGTPEEMEAFLAQGNALTEAARRLAVDVARQVCEDSPLKAWSGVTSPDPRIVVVRVLAPQVEAVFHLLKLVWLGWRADIWRMPTVPPRIWAM